MKKRLLNIFHSPAATRPLPLTLISPQNAGQVVELMRWDIAKGLFKIAFARDGATAATFESPYTYIPYQNNAIHCFSSPHL
jgi:hypothetical protein